VFYVVFSHRACRDVIYHRDFILTYGKHSSHIVFGWVMTSGYGLQVACVLMFHLQQDDFPVDTHVSMSLSVSDKNGCHCRNQRMFPGNVLQIQILQIARTLGWVPEGADAKKSYLHLNRRIPNELKFDLNCLLFTHGKMCNGCSTKLGKHEKKDSIKKRCPLLNYCNNSG